MIWSSTFKNKLKRTDLNKNSVYNAILLWEIAIYIGFQIVYPYLLDNISHSLPVGSNACELVMIVQHTPVPASKATSTLQNLYAVWCQANKVKFDSLPLCVVVKSHALVFEKHFSPLQNCEKFYEKNTKL